MTAETKIETWFPKVGSNSNKSLATNPGNPFVYTLQFETAFDLDQAADTLSTDNLLIPGSGFYVIEGVSVKASEAFAWTTTSAVVGLVEAGGTPSTGAIAAHTFATGTAVGSCQAGTYSSTLSLASAKLKIKGGTAYEVGIVTRPSGGTVTGQIKEMHLLLRPVKSFS